MNPLPYWLALSLLFVEGFAFASVIAGVIYWAWHSQSILVQTIAGVFAVMVGFIVFGLFLLVSIVETKTSFGALVIVLAFSVGQAFFERAIDVRMRPLGDHCIRTFVCYLCSAALGLLAAVGLLSIQGNSARSAYFSDAENFAVMVGYAIGFFFAPLSISFFRWAIPSLRLRPGKDRPLEESDEGEIVRPSR